MKPAPHFNLPDQDGKQHALNDYRGRWLVVYFYPKDDTAGCTTEACSFRDARSELEKLAALVGISTDSVESHKQFAEKYHLNFTLLSDPHHRTIESYNSWDRGTKRNTFLIDPDGNITKEYLGVDPQKHAEQIVRDLKSLQRAN